MDGTPVLLVSVLAALLAPLMVHGQVGATTYPSYDGSGHNDAYPGVGQANTPFSRVAVTAVADYGPSLQGRPGSILPSPRSVSVALLPTPYDKRRSGTRSSEILTYLGQYVSQDISRREDDPQVSAPIPVPVPDPFYSDYVVSANTTDSSTGAVLSAANSLRELPFRRSKAITDARGVRQPLNTISGFIDGNVIYGSSAAAARKLRSGVGGMLRDGGANMLPLNRDDDEPSQILLPMRNDAHRVPATRLRVAGTSAINQNPGMLALATLFLREHNRRAKLLSLAHPEWDDEAIFQAARAWVIAHLQAISYNEYFPKLGIVLPPYSGYRPSVNPGVDNFFAAVAYRYGHSVVTDVVLRLDENWMEHPKGHLPLIQAYYDPDASLSAGLEALLRGLMAKPQGEVEPRWSKAIQQSLFGVHGNGTDLAAINIQRGRDHGIPDYNTCRRQLGLAPKASFAEITSDPTVAAALSKAYNGNIDIVDAYVGGLAEDHYNNSHVGELFYASMVDQLTRLRDGDFWFYLNPSNGLFNETERVEITNTGLAALIARNTNITGMPADIYTVPKEGLGQQCPVELAGSAAPNSQASFLHEVAGGGIRVEFIPEAANGPDWLRVKVTAAGQGFVGFGVPTPGAAPGAMMPGADVIIGRFVNGQPTADDYSVPLDVHTTPLLDSFIGGSSDVKLISLERSNGSTVMVVERPYAASDRFDHAIPKNGPVTFIMSYGVSDELIYHGGLQRDFLTLPNGIFGSSGAVIGGVARPTSISARRAHGALMATNFVLVLPLGALLARQLRARWITSLAGKAALFYVHIITQITGIAIATAGFIIAVNQFDKPYNEVILSHGKLGIAVLALLYSQLLMGFVRPPASSSASPAVRRCWELGHALLGRTAMLLGAVNVFLGIYIFSTLYGGDVGLWGGLCAAGVASLALLQHALDRKDRQAVDALMLKEGVVVGPGGAKGKLLTEQTLRDLDMRHSDDDMGHQHHSKDIGHVPQEAYYADDGLHGDAHGAAGWQGHGGLGPGAAGKRPWGGASGDDDRRMASDTQGSFHAGVAGSDGPRFHRADAVDLGPFSGVPAHMRHSSGSTGGRGADFV